MDWQQELRNICLEVPFETKLTEVYGLCREYLRERGEPCTCRKCNQPFLAHSPVEKLYPTCPGCKTEAKQKNDRACIKEHERRLQKERYKEAQRLRALSEGWASPSAYFWSLRETVTQQEVDQLKSLPYKEFLETRYWKIVSTYVKTRQDKCQLCGSTTQLNVHHKDYTQRGNEIENWQVSLITLCHNCHAKFHDKMVA